MKPLFKNKEIKKLFRYSPVYNLNNLNYEGYELPAYRFNYLEYYNSLSKEDRDEEIIYINLLVDLGKELIEKYLSKNINDKEFIYLIDNVINAIVSIHGMVVNYKKVGLACKVNINMRLLIEKSYKYCKDLPEDTFLKSERMGKWSNCYKRYHPGPHGNYSGLEFSIVVMARDIKFCLTKVIKKYNKKYLNI